MSGKAKRSADKDRRKKEKAARKERNRAHYAELQRQGQNSKSKRHRLNSKRGRVSPNKHQHPFFCGNQGCNKCYPRTPRMHVLIAQQRLAAKSSSASGKVVIPKV